MSAAKEDMIEELTRPIIKLILALVGLYVLRAIVTNLPGLDSGMPGAPISFAIVAGGVITLIMVAIIANFGREIEPRIIRAVSGPNEVIADLAQALKFFIVLVAIILAYSGINSMIIPFLVPDPGAWVYDAIFLLIALIPTLIIARAIFENLDDMADLLTKKVKTVTVDHITCPSCDESVRSSLDFCPNCGEDLPESEIVSGQGSTNSVCPDCGADVSESADFCGSCGTNIEGDN